MSIGLGNTITIHGITAECLIGDLPWERERRQPIRCEVQIAADFTRVAHSDQLGDTIDYAAVGACVREVLQASQFFMLEALGSAICTAVLTRFPTTHVALTLTKQAHFPGAEAVSVHLERTR